jgi:hypothetical protein
METSGLIARGGSSRLLILKNRNALARMAT